MPRITITDEEVVINLDQNEQEYQFGIGDFTVDMWVSADFWHHVAVVRHQGNTTSYLDGQRAGIPTNISAIDELRVSNVARWTDNFTVPEPISHVGRCHITFETPTGKRYVEIPDENHVHCSGEE